MNRSKKMLSLLKANENNSTIKIADLVASTTLAASGLAGAEVIYNFSKLAINAAKQYLVKREEERIIQFHSAMLKNEGDPDEDVMKSSIDVADYQSLLKACLDDMEDEKVGCYAALARAIALGKVQGSLKRNLILTLKDISWDQLDLLGHVYVLTNYEIKPSQGAGCIEPSTVLVKNPNSVRNLDIDFLAYKGLVEQATLTLVGKELIETCFPEELLTPDAYDYQAWLNIRYTIFTLGDGGLVEFAEVVHDTFRKIGVKGGMGPMEGALDRFQSDLHASFFVLLYASGHALPERRLENLKKIVGKRLVIQLIVGEPSDRDNSTILEGEAFYATRQTLKDSLKAIEKRLEPFLRRKKASSK
jgi:hypothetical protein